MLNPSKVAHEWWDYTTLDRELLAAVVPMSLLADHQDVRLNFCRSGIGTCGVEMH